MNGPLLPGEVRSWHTVPTVHFMAHQLGQYETAYRALASMLLARVPPDDDLAVEVRRVLAALDG